MLKNIDLWLMSYLRRLRLINKNNLKKCEAPIQVLFTICDHYEPFWNKVNTADANRRVETWMENYQPIAARHIDCLGAHPQHCFFYPEEEYRPDIMEKVAEICRNGFGEVEIHLHHDNDTAENLRNTLQNFKSRLSQEHGLLAKNENSPEVKYGFIHGNWALDNSRPDGRWCGVNNEIDVLLETGCYADFTMPSAPDITQTSTVNSIYYAIDDPFQPKSHDTGVLAQAGQSSFDGLLCIQGPLTFNWHSRKFGFIPRIENGCIAHDVPISTSRAKLWIEQRVHVSGRPEVIFVKLYTHGTQEKNMEYFFKQNGLDNLFAQLEEYCEKIKGKLYYVSARQMFNVVKGLENDKDGEISSLINSGLVVEY